MARILIIEDDQRIRMAIEETLSLVGYEVEPAENGMQGVEKAHKIKPDLILCDVMMPGMDGFAVLEQLSQYPETSAIPFVFLTALSTYNDIRKGMSLGADDYLTKPFTVQQLLDTVRTRLDRRKLLDQRSTQQIETVREYINLTLPHELRTPLNGIVGYVSMLRDSYEQMDKESMNQMLSGLEKSVERLQVLIENFMAYSQLHLMLQDEELIAKLHQYSAMRDFKEVITYQAEQESFNWGRYTDLRIDVDAAEVLLFSDHASRLISCLISNACKFSERGSVIRLVGRALDDHYLLTITDRGRGMTPEQIASIGVNRQFERHIYEQQGTGLGLTIASQIVRLYGGELSIESIPGKQTTVSLRLQYPYGAIRRR